MDAGQLRAAAERFLPPGSARWDVARVGVRAGRDLRLHLDELRQSFAAGRPRGVGSYAGWLADHRATPAELAAQRAVVANPDRAPRSRSRCSSWPSPATSPRSTRPCARCRSRPTIAGRRA